MFTALALAFGQLGDRRLLGVFVRSLAVTLALFAGVGIALWYALAAWLPDEGTLAGLLAVIATLLLFWLAFRAVAIAVIGVFADDVVAAVEARHYPAALFTARPVSVLRGTELGLRSVARLLGYNLLALPLYVAAAATGIGLPLAFLGVNGVLLARDLSDMVAARHLPRPGIASWRRATRWSRIGVGMVVAGLFTVPIVNIVAPVIGAAAMTHLFHRSRRG